MARPEPTLDVEREFFANGARIVAGMDEVGRGAIAGPVTIGVVVIDTNVGEIPAGLRDSKLMTPKRREAMVPIVKEWARAWATGSATAAEIDKFGIVTALGLAASRALPYCDAHKSRPRLCMCVGRKRDCKSRTRHADDALARTVPALRVGRQ